MRNDLNLPDPALVERQREEQEKPPSLPRPFAVNGQRPSIHARARPSSHRMSLIECHHVRGEK